MTLDTPATDASGARRDRRPAVSGGGSLTRAEYRRIAAEAEAARLEAELAATIESPVASTPAQIVVDTVAAALPLRRRVRAAQEVPPVPAPASHAPEFLDETVILPSATSTHLAAEQPGPRIDDEFELAARVFSFTGETPIQVARAAVDAQETPVARVRTGGAPKARRAKVAFGRLAAASFSVSVVGIVGAFAVVTTTPVSVVSAFGPAASADISLVAPEKASAKTEIQAYVAASDAKSSDLARSDQYDIESMADVAADSGVTQFAGTWVNDSESNIQWPFPVGVPISAAFGSSSYLSKFATPHRGVDLTPGQGAEIHAVAAGTVRIATESGGDYGVTVVIDHIIDGQLVSTRYGHMESGSLRVSAGETVEVGDVIGTVGSTGKSTGPHLHLEVLLGGTQRVDPMAWMYEHTAE
ncbi:murein DD-endopeptidase MepM/ murein hydrolase activator NlpD [Microbacterium marinum]|uniref:Murein DD-endopeptidase MepM/ murein hydrolase activator NlpD n=1 Tax=Microbacterium marinum TaxID=421115 RepID=A0A7W7FJ31_9MICO|nr:peptidoglycan DD-metalloendopeptidase family protein [Microbacterium marinum]MBB4668016.1 murein DD-endopeptidase MepM/ murein hydrolase activator NlpD [Microbacterium marinum]